MSAPHPHAALGGWAGSGKVKGGAGLWLLQQVPHGASSPRKACSLGSEILECWSSRVSAIWVFCPQHLDFLLASHS